MRTQKAMATRFAAALNGPMGESLVATFYYERDSTAARVQITHDFAQLDTILIEYIDGAGVALDVRAANDDSTASGIDIQWSDPPYADLYADELRIKVTVPGGATAEATIHGIEPEELVYDYSPGGLREQAGPETYEYDRGRLTGELKVSGDYLAYGYDEVGNRTSVTVTPAGESTPTSTTIYAYDHLNRLTSVTDDGSTSYTTYAYDKNGNRAWVKYPNGTIAVYTYDEQNRLDTLTNSLGDGTVLSSFDYEVGPAGNRKGVVETIAPVAGTGGTTSNRTITYEYDDLYRLTREYVLEDGEEKLDVTYVYNNKVGNRDVMIREDGVVATSRRTTTTKTIG
jgi:YD repeat-containing protein